MKSGQRRFAMRVLAVAVQGALASLALLPARAADGLGPVTTVPKPRIVKERSMGRRKWPEASLP